MIKDGETYTGLQQQRPPNAQARPEAPPPAFTTRLGTRSGSQNLQATSLLFRHEALRSQSGSGCSSALAWEHACRLDIREGRLAERVLPVASLPSSLEAQALALGAVAPSGAVFLSLRRGAFPPFRTFQRRCGRGRLYALRQKGGTQGSASAEFPRGKGFAVTLSGNGWSPEGEGTSSGRKPAFSRLFKPS